jgi:hypothetical protein
MAHKTDHEKVTVWLPKKEARALKALARKNDRSVTAEARQAIRLHLQEAT